MKERIQLVIGAVIVVAVWGGLGYWLWLVREDQAVGSEGRQVAVWALGLWVIVTLIGIGYSALHWNDHGDR